ncbi:MAG TPA: hypothetical protein VHJ34_14760 [Actinomycetota bacterium]|nr:hypothetical protein [Actinomycetota bacterium]
MQPLALPPNQLHRFYRGGARIAALRATGNDDSHAPEEWIASTTTPFGEDVGISVLPDGTRLPDALAADPEGWLGPEHAARFGTHPALLFKLLDAGERLPVHLHPDDAFARAHLGSRYGKTEAWIVLDAAPGAAVHVGWRDPVSEATLAAWVERRDAGVMLDALHRVDVAPGDTVFVPAGTAHAIGDGVLIAELQQPTDFSILLEWAGFVDDGPAGHLGLDVERALDAVDRSAWSDDDLRRARSGRGPHASRPGAEVLFPAEADAFFRAERIVPAPTPLDASFSVLLVVDGEARAEGDGWTLSLRRGDAVVVPYGAGPCEVAGDADVLRCLPPDPRAPR